MQLLRWGLLVVATWSHVNANANVHVHVHTVKAVHTVRAVSTVQAVSGAAMNVRGGTTTKRTLSSVDLALAGALAAMVGDAAMHPIDCIKTLQQSSEGVGLNMVGAARQIYQQHGVSGFYSGLATYVLSDGVASAVKLTSYEAMKKWVNQRVPEEYTKYAIFGCAALAFVASSVVLVPGELIKQRLQMGQYATLSSGVASIWKESGLRGFFAGYSGVCLRDVPYTMLELGLYDNIKAALTRWNDNRHREDTDDEVAKSSQTDEIVAAAITGGITGYVTNPLDVIKTKLMVDQVGKDGGFVDALLQTWNDYGVAGLFQGGAARVAWLLPFTAIYLPVYDLLKRRLEAWDGKWPVPSQPTNPRNQTQSDAVTLRGGGGGDDTTTSTTMTTTRRQRQAQWKRQNRAKRICFISF